MKFKNEAEWLLKNCNMDKQFLPFAITALTAAHRQGWDEALTSVTASVTWDTSVGHEFNFEEVIKVIRALKLEDE